MNNTVYLIGRIENINDVDDKARITLKVERDYNDSANRNNYIYIPCILKGDIRKKTLEYISVGDLMAIRGTLDVILNEIVIDVNKTTFS